MFAYYRPCSQSSDYPERQIYYQQVEREHRPLLKPEEPRAAHREEKQKQRRKWSQMRLLQSDGHGLREKVYY
jgi:hypothetical protein